MRCSTRITSSALAVALRAGARRSLLPRPQAPPRRREHSPASGPAPS
ncbi:MAG: hypothetical protein AVDCRST_MAG06-1569 [uncultured Nocardioides sp.]|uniref:Uncharacterized protein n=1 Tax=uncultured Nocardioides sp. TaxID=198441 RepID=A0A6J4NT05_9ACTN|nr:MAG: hypothetical protein AVDCRST_MAG06-1569 [uncultured Nocardioides sp.]